MGQVRHVLASQLAAHGQPESGTNCAPVNVSQRVLREVFLRPFKAAVREAGAAAQHPLLAALSGLHPPLVRGDQPQEALDQAENRDDHS